MKKAIHLILLSVLLVLLFHYTKAQYISQKNPAHAFLISNAAISVLYIGVNNPVQVVVSGINDKDVLVTIDTPGTITRDTARVNGYNAIVTTYGKCAIHVSAKINGRLTEIGSQVFRLSRIPGTTAFTNGNLSGGGVPVNRMKAQTGIKARIEGFEWDYRILIKSYNMLFISDGKIFRAQTTGAAFSPEMKNCLQRAKPNDVIFIEDITVMMPDNHVRKLDDMAFYLQ